MLVSIFIIVRLSSPIMMNDAKLLIILQLCKYLETFFTEKSASSPKGQVGDNVKEVNNADTCSPPSRFITVKA